MRKLTLTVLLVLAACAPMRLIANEKDVQLDPGVQYVNYTITASGTASDPIVIYGNGARVKCLTVKGNYVTISNVIASGCPSHGILVTGKNVTIMNSLVYGNVTENGTGPCPGTGSWGSGIKGAVGAENLTVRGNTVYNNCGEGIAFTRVVGGLVEGNTVYDNFSVNIYVDNSNYIDILGNKTTCTDSKFYRNGSPARGITLAAENYSGWGFQFHDVLVERNLIEKCGGPRWYAPGFPTGQGTNIAVRDNLFSGVPSPLVSLPAWVTVSNNVAVGTPTAGPTVIPPTATPTPTKAPATVTPISTKTCYPVTVGGKYIGEFCP